MNNEYMPFVSEILDVKKHTDIEYTFRMSYTNETEVKPGQFFEVSIPKYGEAPISVSGIGKGYVELTIRRVGKVTNEIFEHYVGDKLFLRGPYGNGFDVNLYKDKEVVIIAGGTGVSPVRGVIEYFSNHREEIKNLTLIAGFKSPQHILFAEDFKKWEQNMDVIMTLDTNEGDSSYREGLVTNYIKDVTITDYSNVAAIVVGPPVMMRFSVSGLLNEGLKEEDIWISHERKMCCGIGKCGHCKIDDTYVCLDGPVFNYTKGSQLLD
ncbi:anaerobic sulfite reductase subunit B [Anaeromicropila herbilytica]|uniref:Anaerobic sulfite reductase subunit B n=2 Tax=Anaeromicropila herbilytica TaxID=2785025 RepID=A0A7R7IEQ7_9FIRM|nr:anaerobic sulfite reductase subunit AsrB [Anaeromicropila herbilytica]BCN31358.1 anaerobic sulfite reductase subunit B [Anaeromicropila herbilytica]